MNLLRGKKLAPKKHLTLYFIAPWSTLHGYLAFLRTQDHKPCLLVVRAT